MKSKFISTLILLISFNGQSSSLPFGFNTSESIENSKYERATNMPEERYCPSKSNFPTKEVVFLSQNFSGLYALDLLKLTNQKYLNRFSLLPNDLYLNMENDKYFLNNYKESKDYKEAVFVIRKILDSNVYKKALIDLPSIIPVEQRVYKVDGGYICTEYIDGKLWLLSISNEAMSARFEDISNAVVDKYKSFADVTHGVAECAEFYRRYSSANNNNECVIKRATFERDDGVSIKVQLRANDYKKKPFERLNKFENLGREKGGYIHYFDQALYDLYVEKNNIQWEAFSKKYHEQLKIVYKKALEEFNAGDDVYLEQF